MQPLSIVIKGDYFDCQIYRGRLYLWCFNGDLEVYDWTKIVHSFIKRETDKIAMTFSFLDGNYLYKSSLIELFRDSDFKKLLLKKFDKVSNKSFELSKRALGNCLLGTQDTPSGILPTDTEIYGNQLYFINEKGLYRGAAHRELANKYLVSSRPKKLWDCNLLSIKANKYPQLALSAGDEGLFELNMANNQPSNLNSVERAAPIFHLSSNHSSFSNYTYLDIYNSSLVHHSYLAQFKWNSIENNAGPPRFSRDYDGELNDQLIFRNGQDNHSISWGVDDKIYKPTDNGFEIVKYNRNAKVEDGQEKFQKLDSVTLRSWKGGIIGGGSAYFGVIVECDNALVVILSNGDIKTIPGPITRWRVYPRSLNYENHLHVILEDRVEIHSFNHDYFTDQRSKQFGIQFKNTYWKGRSSPSYFEDTDESLFT